MKTCTKCGETKHFTEYHKYPRNSDGLRGLCKVCVLAQNAVWRSRNEERAKFTQEAYRAANPEKITAQHAAYRRKNREKEILRQAAYRKANPEKVRAQHAAHVKANIEKVIASRVKYRKANPEKLAAKTARRRAQKLQATPDWAEEFIIEEAYSLASLRTRMFGFEWHVDHIVPLRGKTVCGLHVHTNLQVIPGPENLSKYNRYWPDMPTAHSEQHTC